MRKLNAESAKLEKELEQSLTDQEVKFERALDIQRKMLENEKLQIACSGRKLISLKLSALASKGIIEADMIRIDINDVLFLLKEKGKIKEVGPDISDIT